MTLLNRAPGWLYQPNPLMPKDKLWCSHPQLANPILEFLREEGNTSYFKVVAMNDPRESDQYVGEEVWYKTELMTISYFTPKRYLVWKIEVLSLEESKLPSIMKGREMRAGLLLTFSHGIGTHPMKFEGLMCILFENEVSLSESVKAHIWNRVRTELSDARVDQATWFMINTTLTAYWRDLQTTQAHS